MQEIRLELIAQIPNFRVLTWDNGYLYGSRGYTLFKICEKDIRKGNLEMEEVGSFRPDFIRGIATKNRLLTRLFRTGFQAIKITDSKIIGIVAKNIVLLEPGSKEFFSTFKIKRGTRPHGMAVTPDGRIYWGEYFNNPKREEVHIYGSDDGGYTWSVIYTFPKGSIRHIHNILYDPYEKCLWVLAGDEDREPRILRVSLDWKDIKIIREGNQQCRVATMIFREESIFYATDTPYEQNYIYQIERKTGKIAKITPISGPSMWSCEVNLAMFFSAAAEPGIIYYPAACIYGSRDGDKWYKLIEWPKDSLHPKYFQFGNIILPKGNNNTNILAATAVAVKGWDGKTQVWVCYS